VQRHGHLTILFFHFQEEHVWLTLFVLIMSFLFRAGALRAPIVPVTRRTISTAPRLSRVPHGATAKRKHGPNKVDAKMAGEKKPEPPLKPVCSYFLIFEDNTYQF
jgi:hypothetical protein